MLKNKRYKVLSLVLVVFALLTIFVVQAIVAYADECDDYCDQSGSHEVAECSTRSDYGDPYPGQIVTRDAGETSGNCVTQAQFDGMNTGDCGGDSYNCRTCSYPGGSVSNGVCLPYKLVVSSKTGGKCDDPMGVYTQCVCMREQTGVCDGSSPPDPSPPDSGPPDYPENCNVSTCRDEVSVQTTASRYTSSCEAVGYEGLGSYIYDGGDTCFCCVSCGDNVCNGSETFATCPQDCEPIVCGDSTCNGSETCSSCPTDCGVCDPGCTPNCSLCAPDTCVGNTCTEPACNTACSGTKDCGGPPPVTSIGFVNVQTTSGLIKLNVKALSDADLYDIVRIMMPGGVIGVADLVEAEDRNGSPVKIYLNAAFRAKFWRKLD